MQKSTKIINLDNVATELEVVKKAIGANRKSLQLKIIPFAQLYCLFTYSTFLTARHYYR